MVPQLHGEDIPLSGSALLGLENGKTALIAVSLGMGLLPRKSVGEGKIHSHFTHFR